MNTIKLRGATSSPTSQGGRRITVASRESGQATDQRLSAGNAGCRVPTQANQIPVVPDNSAQPTAPPTLSVPSPVQEGTQPCFTPHAPISLLAHSGDHQGEILPSDLEPVLPKRIRLAFFGPMDCVTSRPAFLLAANAATESVLKGCHYSRQRNSANGVPFLVLSIRKISDIKKFWMAGMTPFVFDLNKQLKLFKCRVALYDQFAWMSFPPNDERNAVLMAPNENPILVVRNRFSVLSEAGEVGTREEANEPCMGTCAHAMGTDTATVTRKDKGKFKAGCLNVRGLKIASQSDKVSDIGAVLQDKGVNICAVQETWLDPSIDEIKLPGYQFVGTAG